jgi:PST family polysaccharide transporter
VQSFAARGITSISFLIVGLYLGPEEYGLYALVAGIIVLSEMVCEQSLSQAIVQMESVTNGLLSAVLHIGISLAVIISIAMLLGGRYIGLYFDEPRLANLLYIAAPLPILMSLSAVPMGMLRREMNFKALTKRTIYASGLSSVVGIVLVIIGYGALGLIIQTICYYSISVFMLWVQYKWRPTRSATVFDVKYIMKLSGANAGSKLSDYFETRGIEIIIGAVAGLQAMGVYAFASKIAQIAFQMLYSPILEVVLVGVARDKNRAVDTINLGLLITSTLPAMVFYALACGAYPLLNILYGNLWESAALPLTIISTSLLIRGWLYVYGIGLQALGLSTVAFAITLFRAVLCIGVSFVALNYVGGPVGGAIGYLISTIIVLPINTYVLSTKLNTSQLTIFRFPIKAAISLLVAFVVFIMVGMAFGNWAVHRNLSILAVLISCFAYIFSFIVINIDAMYAIANKADDFRYKRIIIIILMFVRKILRSNN